MKKFLGITLGIMTALGGFIDLGQIVFTLQAGALFGYALLWAIVLGTAAIIVYMEMCGRIAVVTREPVFSVLRTQLGFKAGLATLIASNLLDLITCAAELAGVAILLNLVSGWNQKLLLVAATLVLGLVVHAFKFRWIERTFGLAGLLMIVCVVSAVSLHPNWTTVAHGLLPTLPRHDLHGALLYGYFAVGVFSAVLMVYEVHFYSSGAIEEDWKTKDLSENFFVASLGATLGALLTAALLVLGALVFRPDGIFPEILSTSLIAEAFPFAHRALIIALLGSLACVSGAALETALSGAYNLCQFFNLPWGKDLPAKSARVYTLSWTGMLVLGMVISLTGIRPLTLINISVIFGMVVMPFTYYPILRVAEDKKLMGKHGNSKADSAVGWLFLVLITLAAAAALPLMVLTHSGQP